MQATTKAVKNQFSNRKLLACLELHTYSSLNAEFLKHYEAALDAADEAVVFYSPEAVAIKKMKEVTQQQILDAFQHKNLKVFTDPTNFKNFLFDQKIENKSLLLMSSGNYGGLNFEDVKELF